MMTSRSEYRLLLRQDNADARLTPIGYDIGLISNERYAKFLEKKQMIEDEIKRLEGAILSPTEALNAFLQRAQSSEVKSGVRLAELIRRPEISYTMLKEIDANMPSLPADVTEQAEISIKYEGYIKRQLAQAEQFKKLENKRLAENLDYSAIYGLRIEARQKLLKIRPRSVGQASRISGVSPADIAVLLIYLEQRRGTNDK